MSFYYIMDIAKKKKLKRADAFDHYKQVKVHIMKVGAARTAYPYSMLVTPFCIDNFAFRYLAGFDLLFNAPETFNIRVRCIIYL